MVSEMMTACSRGRTAVHVLQMCPWCVDCMVSSLEGSLLMGDKVPSYSGTEMSEVNKSELKFSPSSHGT